MRIAAMVAVMMVVLGGFAGTVLAADPAETKLTIENNKFSPEELKVKANTPFVIVVTNKDKTPEEFLTKCGFRVLRDHPRYPLLRLDLMERAESPAMATERVALRLPAFQG